MEGADSVIPEKFQRRAEPLTPEAIEALDKSALVGSFEEAMQAVRDKNLEYPILVIPRGENFGEDFHVVNNEQELEIAFEKAQRVGVGGQVHLTSRHPQNIESGVRESEAKNK